MTQNNLKAGATPEGENYVIYRVGDRDHLRLYFDGTLIVAKSAKTLSALRQNFVTISGLGTWQYSNDDCDSVGFFKLYHRAIDPDQNVNELKVFNESEECV